MLLSHSSDHMLRHCQTISLRLLRLLRLMGVFVVLLVTGLVIDAALTDAADAATDVVMGLLLLGWS